jgi:hypothetical protein
VKHARSLFLVVFIAVVLLSSLQARADEPAVSPEQTKATEIKKRGDDAMESGRPADALTAYTEAYALSKDPALLFNKGRALQALGEYPQALAELDAFDKTAPAELKARVPGLAKLIDGVKQKVTTITISCDVDRAQIRLRDRTIGRCPMIEPMVVNAGKGRLEVTADGYFPWTRDLDLPPGGTGSFDVHLASKATMGIIVVKSNVANTVVSIDGKQIGQVPAEANLDAGTHEVTLSHEGYEQAKRSAVVFAGERRELDVPLQAEASIFKKWWFWTAAGVVVLGGVTLAIVLTSEKDPEPGTVPPGVVKGGLSLGGLRF